MHTGQLNKTEKKLAILIDPDKANTENINRLFKPEAVQKADYLLVGGSLLYNHLEDTIHEIKNHTNLPIIIFPGNAFQISNKADGFMLLNLISGRNPDFLIGHHVMAAPKLKCLQIPVISTGYMLFNCGKMTSVQYMSDTTALPLNKPDLAVATAMAGEMIGMQQLYLEAGSGADEPVPTNIIESVSKAVDIPLIVGGGIRKPREAADAWNAGANLVVVGNAAEQDPTFIEALISAREDC